MSFDQLTAPARRIAALLTERGESVAVAEGSAGGLVSAALLSIPGASAYYRGGVVVYTMAARTAFLGDAVELPEGLRGATEVFARYVAESAAAQLGTTWGLGEAGAAGPANPYGDPAGHCWLAVAGPTAATRHVLTGVDDRTENMFAFASACLELFEDTLHEG